MALQKWCYCLIINYFKGFIMSKYFSKLRIYCTFVYSLWTNYCSLACISTAALGASVAVQCVLMQPLLHYMHVKLSEVMQNTTRLYGYLFSIRWASHTEQISIWVHSSRAHICIYWGGMPICPITNGHPKNEDPSWNGLTGNIHAASDGHLDNF